MLVEGRKEFCELFKIVIGNLNNNLVLILRFQLAVFTESLLRILEHFGVHLGAGLEHGEVVAAAELLLQEEGRAEAGNFPLDHDADSVAEDISFVHIMCGQQNDPIFPIFFQHVP